MDQKISNANTPNCLHGSTIHLLEHTIAYLAQEGYIIYGSKDRLAAKADDQALLTSGIAFEFCNEFNDEALSALWSIFEDENESGYEVPTASEIIIDDFHEVGDERPSDEIPSANRNTKEGENGPRTDDGDLLELDEKSRLLHLHRHFLPRIMIHNRCLGCPTNCPNSHHNRCYCRDFCCGNCISCRDCQVLQFLMVGRISWGCDDQDDQVCARAKDRVSSQADGGDNLQPGALTVEHFPPLP
ncbi:hypothetical protein EYC80_011160 [Monilinia laxa]|uniref:Uncharacterized protein n=1 Tax=Monilinia laxa TaxID=61186 RepID=A0A5N6JP60_MONLA|nr:hypothetical protein EYC80_011160 [Monilinia laxa]